MPGTDHKALLGEGEPHDSGAAGSAPSGQHDSDTDSLELGAHDGAWPTLEFEFADEGPSLPTFATHRAKREVPNRCVSKKPDYMDHRRIWSELAIVQITDKFGCPRILACWFTLNLPFQLSV